jgi:hypothetical protein
MERARVSETLQYSLLPHGAITPSGISVRTGLHCNPEIMQIMLVWYESCWAYPELLDYDFPIVRLHVGSFVSIHVGLLNCDNINK